MKYPMIFAAALVSGLLGFYGVWPAVSALGIKTALETRDSASLESRIDFESVRASLRPAVTAKVTDALERYQQRMGAAGGLIMGQLKGEAVPKLVDASLRTLVTPVNLIRVVHDARPLKETIEGLLKDYLAKTMGGEAAGGGLLDRVLRRETLPSATTEPVSAPAAVPDASPRRFTVANVKRFAFSGPLAFQLGLAKDPAASEAEITAEMRFVQGTWKLTGVSPKF